MLLSSPLILLSRIDGDAPRAAISAPDVWIVREQALFQTLEAAR